jgi:hypothetical protein
MKAGVVQHGLTGLTSRPDPPDLEYPFHDRALARHSLRPYLPASKETQYLNRPRRISASALPKSRGNSARDLHQSRPGIYRPGSREPCKPSTPVGALVVTYVLSTFAADVFGPATARTIERWRREWDLNTRHFPKDSPYFESLPTSEVSLGSLRPEACSGARRGRHDRRPCPCRLA